MTMIQLQRVMNLQTFRPPPHPTLENLLIYADRCHIKDYFPLNNATIKY